jgi:hypothetical protein
MFGVTGWYAGRGAARVTIEILPPTCLETYET